MLFLYRVAQPIVLNWYERNTAFSHSVCLQHLRLAVVVFFSSFVMQVQLCWIAFCRALHAFTIHVVHCTFFLVLFLFVVSCCCSCYYSFWCVYLFIYFLHLIGSAWFSKSVLWFRFLRTHTHLSIFAVIFNRYRSTFTFNWHSSDFNKILLLQFNLCFVYKYFQPNFGDPICSFNQSELF